jgi:hypothetical protein
MSWVNKFGVQISSRDKSIGEVVSVKCLFCQKYGKEEEEEETDNDGNNHQKQRKTLNVKYFKKPWRSDKLHSQMNKQHGKKFEKYQKLDNNGWKSFFSRMIVLSNL